VKGARRGGGAHDDFRKDLVAAAPGDSGLGELNAAAVNVDPVLDDKKATDDEHGS
jgi:hypothetical protein